MVRKFTLNDGSKIPALAWGNGTGGINSASQKAIDLGKEALNAGIVHIDTAQIYNTEAETHGAVQAAGAKRENIWITSKIGRDDVKTTPESIRQNVKDTLDKLQTIPNLLLIHNPYVPEEGKIAEFWQILEGLVEDGTLRGCSLGVSNFRPQDLKAVLDVCKIKPAVNQLEYHPYVLAHLDPILKIQEQHNIVTEAYGPLTPILRHPSGGPLKPILARIAKRLGTSPSGVKVDEGTVLLLWTMAKGVVAVTASTKVENLKKMSEIQTWGDLTAEEIKEIEEAGRKVHFRGYKEHMYEDFPSPDLPEDI